MPSLHYEYKPSPKYGFELSTHLDIEPYEVRSILSSSSERRIGITNRDLEFIFRFHNYPFHQNLDSKFKEFYWGPYLKLQYNIHTDPLLYEEPPIITGTIINLPESKIRALDGGIVIGYKLHLGERYSIEPSLLSGLDLLSYRDKDALNPNTFTINPDFLVNLKLGYQFIK